MTTQYANASYQEIIDLHTESDTVSVVGVHTPLGDVPREMMPGFFMQFNRYKYNGCSLQLVPAARLPADPLQVSYEAGETTIDPRDLLNPIVWHGCHGENLGSILNSFYYSQGNTVSTGSVSSSNEINNYLLEDLKESDSAAQMVVDSSDTNGLFGQLLENLYYKAITDNTWAKAHPLKGFRKSGLRPLVYQMAVNMQLGQGQSNTGNRYPGNSYSNFDVSDDEYDSDSSLSNYGVTSSSNGSISGPCVPSPNASYGADSDDGETYTYFVSRPNSWTNVQYLTTKLTGLGWRDTRQRSGSGSSNITTVDDLTLENVVDVFTESKYATLPQVYMGMFILPPAYKTEQYYRLILNHSFSFKGFRGVSLLTEFNDIIEDNGNVANWNA